MKKLSTYLLLLSLIIIFISACGSKDDTQEAAPSPPSTVGAQLRADAGDKQVTLYWPMVAGADTYNVYYIEDSSGTYGSSNLPSSAVMKAGTKIESLPSAPRTVTGLNNGTTYYFAFTAVSTNGESDLSEIIPATPSAPPPPAAPTNFRANAGDEKITVTWTPVTANPPVASYNIHILCTEDLNWEYGLVTVPGQATSSKIVDSGITWIMKPSTWADGLENGRRCTFTLTAETAETGPSAEVVAAPSTTASTIGPVTDGAVVASITATTGNTQQVTISWVALPGAHPYISYNLYYYPNGSPGTVTEIPEFMSGDAVTGLTDGISYHFYLKSVTASGPSFSVLATPTATPPPAAPFISTVTAGDGQVYLEWNDVGATSYNVYSSNVMGLSKEVYSGKATGTGIAFTATNLTNDTKYYFVVTAVNANGESAESNEVSATPTASP